MRGAHFYKNPDVCVLMELLDSGDVLANQWSVSAPYTLFVAWGEVVVNGAQSEVAPGFVEFPAGAGPTLEGAQEDTVVMFLFLTQELVEDLSNGLELENQEYAGTWRDQLSRNAGPAITQTDLEQLVDEALTNDEVYMAGLGL